jgi:membrane associated rhomboid family serine protease
VSSALAFYVFDEGILVGCSGGVFCLVAASLSTCIMNWKEDKAVLIRVWKKNTPIAYAGGMSRNLKVTGIIMFALLSFGSAAWRRYHLEDAGVSVLAHIFGALTGFLTGFTLLKDEKEGRWDRAWKQFCMRVFSVAFGMAVVLNIVEYRGVVKVFSF